MEVGKKVISKERRAELDKERWRRMKILKHGAEFADISLRGKHGNHARGEKNGRWLGGRRITKTGYVTVRVPHGHHLKNLEVLPSIAHHRTVHRRPGGPRRRLPGEANHAKPCSCGCGGTIKAFDRYGVFRRYIHGHNLNRVTPGRTS